MAKIKQSYRVTTRLNLLADISIAADSFEEAIQESKTLKEQDFVKFKGDFVDGNIEIISVTKDDGWNIE